MSGRKLEGKSRMTRECHVRFCEGGGVRFPSATRLVICCRQTAAQVQPLVTQQLQALGLTLNPAKTRVLDARQQPFTFQRCPYT